MKKKNEFIIFIFSILLVILFMRGNIFGSNVDFLSQHVVFPNYLRELFYSSGQIIPKFMINLGAGQNIFNIAYYGLFNPIILISYFFPFIKMVDYIVISNVLLFIFSNLLFYKFVNDKFDERLSLFLTFLFMFSGPLIFQFHRHFMFVNYMPFLILSLINIDKERYSRVIIDVFLIIMISFYFSIPAIIVVIIYYIYVNFDKFDFKCFFKFLCCILISILMSSILLFPTFSAIMSSRTGSSSFNFRLFLVDFNLDNLLYGAYCPGLTSIAFISILFLFFSKSKKNIFLGSFILVLVFIPFFLFILNGGLYVRGKVLIPFVPLLVYIVGILFDSIDNIDIRKFIIFIIFCNLIVLVSYHVTVYYLDLFFMLLLLIVYNFCKKKELFSLIVVFNLIVCIFLNFDESYVSRDYFNSLDYTFSYDDFYRVSNLNNISDTVNMSNGNFISSIYSSTNNKFFNNFYHNVFKVNNSQINNLSLSSTSNVLYNEFMSNKYVIGNDLGYPYRSISDGVYVLDQVMPIGYVIHDTVNRFYYESLEYPYNLDILLKYVVDSDSSNYPVSEIKEVNLDFDYTLGSNMYIEGNMLYVLSDGDIGVSISDDLSGKILFISVLDQFEQDDDIVMSINGQANLLTKSSWLYPNHNNDFNYCISGSNKLDIHVTKGVYNISNIRTYVLDNSSISDISVDEFNISVMNSEVIKGDINVTQDGYFILKIPYDRGFKIMVNDDIIDYEIVDDAFIGFYLNKGFYDIEITYMPPYLKEGIICSIVGFGLFLFFRRSEK